MRLRMPDIIRLAACPKRSSAAMSQTSAAWRFSITSSCRVRERSASAREPGARRDVARR